MGRECKNVEGAAGHIEEFDAVAPLPLLSPVMLDHRADVAGAQAVVGKVRNQDGVVE